MCSADHPVVPCSLTADGSKAFRLPAGIFEISEQLLVPERTSITGASAPNDMANPAVPPDWASQTLFLATRGSTAYLPAYCRAADMVRTRVGLVLSSHVSVRNVSYQGIDTIRPEDNGSLCGGGAFETKGCATNDCSTDVNNGGSDGLGSVNVSLEDVRLNDYYFAEDRALVGATIPGNYDCSTSAWKRECCFCKPNGVRSTQVGVWVPATRDAAGTVGLRVRRLVSSSSQADGINLHGFLSDALVENVFLQNTGDDVLALWGANRAPADVTFRDCAAVNPGVLRPKWYGNCVATYGLQSVIFERLRCAAPTLDSPRPQPGTNVTRIATSMFVFYTSFGGLYPEGNRVELRGGWDFTDLSGEPYTPAEGTMGSPGLSGLKAWTAVPGGTVAPFYEPSKSQQVGVVVTSMLQHSR